MKKISILVPESAVLASVNDPRLMFTTANQFLQASGMPDAFHVQLVGLTREVKFHESIFTVHTDATIHEVENTDMVFVPALAGDMLAALEANKDLLPWIVK